MISAKTKTAIMVRFLCSASRLRKTTLDTKRRRTTNRAHHIPGQRELPSAFRPQLLWAQAWTLRILPALPARIIQTAPWFQADINVAVGQPYEMSKDWIREETGEVS